METQFEKGKQLLQEQGGHHFDSDFDSPEKRDACQEDKAVRELILREMEKASADKQGKAREILKECPTVLTLDNCYFQRDGFYYSDDDLFLAVNEKGAFVNPKYADVEKKRAKELMGKLLIAACLFGACVVTATTATLWITDNNRKAQNDAANKEQMAGVYQKVKSGQMSLAEFLKKTKGSSLQKGE